MENVKNNFYYESMQIIAPPPPKFTLNEWYLNNRLKYRFALDQEQLADKVLAESDRKNQAIKEITLTNKRNVDHKIKEKIKDIEFVNNEILIQRQGVCEILDALIACNEAIMNALAGIGVKSFEICRKCIIFREGRVGIDLCFDDVDRELRKELEGIEGAKNMLTRTLEQSNEQARRLRSTIYFIDRDLENKANVFKIDRQNLQLNQHSLNLSTYHGFTPLDPANITNEEWEAYTNENIARCAKEINNARLFHIYVDNLLKQTTEDLIGQYHIVNEAFRRRIAEMKEAKTTLELHHSEITRQANEMTLNIIRTEKELQDHEGFMALSHTRLGNRCQRPGMELCKDLLETNLVKETREIRENCYELQQSLAMAQASLRYLLKTVIQLEEDINVKTNSLKIDEVDCMTIRQSMIFYSKNI